MIKYVFGFFTGFQPFLCFIKGYNAHLPQLIPGIWLKRLVERDTHHFLELLNCVKVFVVLAVVFMIPSCGYDGRFTVDVYQNRNHRQAILVQRTTRTGFLLHVLEPVFKTEIKPRTVLRITAIRTVGYTPFGVSVVFLGFFSAVYRNNLVFPVTSDVPCL